MFYRQFEQAFMFQWIWISHKSGNEMLTFFDSMNLLFFWCIRLFSYSSRFCFHCQSIVVCWKRMNHRFWVSGVTISAQKSFHFRLKWPGAQKVKELRIRWNRSAMRCALVTKFGELYNRSLNILVYSRRKAANGLYNNNNGCWYDVRSASFVCNNDHVFMWIYQDERSFFRLVLLLLRATNHICQETIFKL